MTVAKSKQGAIHSEVDRLQIAGLTWNFAPFGLIFTSRKFMEAARVVVAQEQGQTHVGWYPVGKYLACHSIELSLKAFLTLKGERLLRAKRFGHNLSNLLDISERRGLWDMVALSVDERTEIQRTSPYYSEKVFEYPSLVEAARAYPGEPDSSHLLAAAEKPDSAG